MALVLTLAGLLGLALNAPPASAHAHLIRSLPVANSVMAEPPQTVQLWFSETPETRFADVSIFSSTSERVSTGAVRVAPDDPHSLILHLDPLAPGAYTVRWKTPSAVDGHTTVGAFGFAVGTDQSVSGAASADAAPPTGVRPAEVALRWLTYASLAGLLGAVAFGPLVLTPALRALGRSGSAAVPQAAVAGLLRPAATYRIRRLAWAWFWLAGVATLATALVQLSIVADVPLSRALSPVPGSPVWNLILETRFGWVWLGRMALLVLFGAALSGLSVAVQAKSAGRTSRWGTQALEYAAVGLAGGLALTSSLNSHAAALAPAAGAGAPLVPVLAGWLHLVATGLWIGGLCGLLVTLPARSVAGHGHALAFVASLVASFSVVASVSVGAILFTGTFQAWLQVVSWEALFGTEYGRALLFKLVLTAPLLLLGALNLLVTGPRLARAVGEGLAAPAVIRALRLAVGTETALACGVIAVASVIALSQPAKDAWTAHPPAIVLEHPAGDLRLHLQVDPQVQLGHTFGLLVRDREGRPLTGAKKVALVLTMAEHDMGESELVLEPQGEGWYRAETALTSMAGRWQAEALVRRADQDDVSARFVFRIPASA